MRMLFSTAVVVTVAAFTIPVRRWLTGSDTAQCYFARYRSLVEFSQANQLLSGVRLGFGGHVKMARDAAALPVRTAYCRRAVQLAFDLSRGSNDENARVPPSDGVTLCSLTTLPPRLNVSL